MKEIVINLPLDDKTASGLKAGDRVLLNGIIYTARDAAHKKMVEEMESGKPLPIEIKDQTIYYAGPCPAKPGDVIGSIGPTTSGRMDSYAPKLIEKGLKGMIGKGERNQDVISAIKEHGAVYFGAVGGAGALLKESVVSAQVVAYDELGTEAIRKLKVKNFPAVVIIDSSGENLYITQTKKYKRTLED
jgi:fumarate hydratase subunit beta